MTTSNLPLVGDPNTAFRFSIYIDGIYSAAFSEFTLPSLDVETEDIIEGGQNAFVHKLPVRVKSGGATMRHGVTDDLQLLHWYVDVIKGDIAAAKREIAIVLYGANLQPSMIWSFRSAFPVKWSGPTLKADDSSIAFEEIEFVHHGFTIETLKWDYLGDDSG